MRWLVFLLVFTLLACGGEDPVKPDDGKTPEKFPLLEVVPNLSSAIL